MTSQSLRIAAYAFILCLVAITPASAQKSGGPTLHDDLQLSPSGIVDFGSRDIAASPIVLNVRLENPMTQSADVDIPAQLGAFRFLSGAGSYTLAPYQFEMLSIEYTPTLLGHDSAELHVSPDFDLVLTLAGIATSTKICGVDDAEIDFGSVTVGSPQELIVLVGNGAASTQLLRLEGSCDAFSLNSAPVISVDPGQTGQFLVEFNPLYEGGYVGEFTSGCGSSVWLTGTGVSGSAKQLMSPAQRVASNSLSMSVSPNPALHDSVIRYANIGQEPIAALLRIVDLRGRVVRSQSLDISIGNHLWQWDGRDHAGQSVAAGVYMIELVAPGTTVHKKVTILR